MEDLNRLEEELMLPMFSIEECDGDSKGKILSTEKSQTLSSHFS